MRNWVGVNSDVTPLIITGEAVEAALLEEKMPEFPLFGERIWKPLAQLLQYVRSRNYEGYDWVDGLGGVMLTASPSYRSSLVRMAVAHWCESLPRALRPLMLGPPDFSPYGGACFLQGHLNLLRMTGEAIYENESYILFQRLKHEMLPRVSGVGWGRQSDWQTRHVHVPKDTPDLISSVYVGRALLAYYHQFGEREALELALGVMDFLLAELVRFEDSTLLCFSKVARHPDEIHHINLLGASYLAQLLSYLPEAKQAEMRAKITKATRFSILDISPEGAWPIGIQASQRRVEHVAMALSIESLIYIRHYLDSDDTFSDILLNVSEYYLACLFTDEGKPKAFNGHTDPTTIHVLSEAIILIQLLRAHRIEGLSQRIHQIGQALLTLVQEFQDPTGFFYYQKSAGRWNRNPYMGWGQAGLFYALTTCLQNPYEAA